MARYKSPATRRYLIRMIVLMSLYVVLIFAAGWTFRHTDIAGFPAYALAIAPALPLIGVFWAVMRLLVEEPDEFIRIDRKSTRLNSSHSDRSRMPSSA